MKAILIILFLPLKLFSQDITGLWKGTIYNDTTKENISYEIAISEYRGKLSGYSHTIFVIDDKENVGVKSIYVKIKNDKIFIEDNAFMWNNYAEPPPKGVKMYSLLNLSLKDTVMILSGVFNTNRTRQYRPLTGTVHLEKRNNASPTRLIAKLNELDLSKSLSFLQPKEKEKEPEIVAVKESGPVLIAQKSKKDTVAVTREPKTIITPPVKTQKKDKEVVAVTRPGTKILIPPTDSKKEKVTNVPRIKPPASEIASRIIETIQSVSLKSDSITITLYDNGEVDGDTVSILLNGKVIIPRQGLSTTAVTKTIYITPDLGDSVQLIMYAENLGSIPPNTGLLILQDGDSRYEIRFAGDMQKNSAIILKRRPQ